VLFEAAGCISWIAPAVVANAAGNAKLSFTPTAFNRHRKLAAEEAQRDFRLRNSLPPKPESHKKPASAASGAFYHGIQGTKAVWSNLTP
jgi:hypothetical protein